MPIKLKVEIPSRLMASFTATVQAKVAAVQRSALTKMAALAVDRISTKADSKLGARATEYKNGITVAFDEAFVRISLQGGLAQALEYGFNSFDIKSRMLRSPKAKVSKKGEPFVDVAFRHSMEQDATHLRGVPDNIATQMRRAVTTAIHQAMSKMPLQQASIVPVRLERHSRGAAITKQLITASKRREWISTKHKRGLYDDLTRTAVWGKDKAISQYRTMRRISNNSDPTSWIHPGFVGVHAIRDTSSGIRAEAKKIIVGEFKAAGFKVKI